jgi:Zn-dependent M32 family carboxypeptidase
MNISEIETLGDLSDYLLGLSWKEACALDFALNEMAQSGEEEYKELLDLFKESLTLEKIENTFDPTPLILIRALRKIEGK